MNKGTHFNGQPMYGQLLICLTGQKFFVSAVKVAVNAM